jgi:SAM-dependent methyltransferase
MIKSKDSIEQFVPMRNLPPVGFPGSILFYCRLFFDFQVRTVYFSLKHFISVYLLKNTAVLEVGCGLCPYQHLFKNHRYFSADYSGAHEHFGYQNMGTVYYSGSRLPFPDNQYDAVIFTETLEHIFNYNAFLEECYRILKPDSHLFFTVPFSARYHYQPHDYWRFTPSALKNICTNNNFNVISVSERGSDIHVILNKIIVLSMKYLRFSSFRWTIRPFLIFISPLVMLTICACAVLGNILFFIPIGSIDDCLGYSVIAKKDL